MVYVGNPEEKVKLNTPVPAPHDVPYYSISPPLLSHVSNPDSDISLVSYNDFRGSNNDCATEMVQWDEGGK